MRLIEVPLPFFYRYVDDILLAVPENVGDKIISVFNFFHERLKFTAEKEQNHYIKFLDLAINNSDGSFKIDWLHKKKVLREISFVFFSPFFMS